MKHKIHNVDQDEIEKFSVLASRWWYLNGEFKPLHQINPLRLRYVIDKSQGLSGKNVLDVGCGGGILTESMSKQGANVTGLDMGKQPLEVAKAHAKTQNMDIHYIQETVENHAISHAGRYDVITCMEMLEHVPNPSSIIQACSALVKPNGHVFFSTLNRNLKSYLFAIVGAEQLLKVVPEGTHDHQKFIRPAELISFIDRTDLQEQGIIGIIYNPLTDNYRLTTNVDINYIVHTQKI